MINEQLLIIIVSIIIPLGGSFWSSPAPCGGIWLRWSLVLNPV